jgi:hypothetical protein
MVQRSDDKGDKRSSGKSTESGASRDAETNAANALRERIRQAGAGGGSATARASDHAPADGLVVPSSSAPPAAEHSGVRTRPPEPRSTSITPPLFGPPKLSPGAMSVPWPSVPRTRPQAKTRVGLGAPPAEPETPPGQPSPAALSWAENGSLDDSEAITADMQAAPPAAQSSPIPRSAEPTPHGVGPSARLPADSYLLSTARTQPMPRVRGGAASHAAAGGGEAEVDERRRVELATTRKTQGLLRAPESSSGKVGRYSVQDVSTEYVDSGMPEPMTHAQSTGEEVRLPDPAAFEPDPNGPAESESEGTRPRRSTPKQRVGHRRSTRPEVGHARERGTKRTDPGIRARTLRGGNVGPLTPMSPPSSPAPRPAPVDPGTVLVDPSLTLPPPAAAPPPLKPKHASGYVPLPRDREAYEAFLRSAAGEHGGPPRARPSWAQQETALIPRDSLQPSFEYEAERTGSRGAWIRSALGLVFIVVGGLTLWWTFFREEAPMPQRATDHDQYVLTSPQSAAAKAITLIATEPSGAEVLLDGAVIGNTPLEVTRPAQGQALYIVRLHNFEQQMVRITSVTHSAIHITLSPVPNEPPPPSAAKR